MNGKWCLFHVLTHNGKRIKVVNYNDEKDNDDGDKGHHQKHQVDVTCQKDQKRWM